MSYVFGFFLSSLYLVLQLTCLEHASAEVHSGDSKFVTVVHGTPKMSWDPTKPSPNTEPRPHDPSGPAGPGGGGGGSSTPPGGGSGTPAGDDNFQPLNQNFCSSGILGMPTSGGGSATSGSLFPLATSLEPSAQEMLSRWKAVTKQLVEQGIITSVKQVEKNGKFAYLLRVRDDTGPFQGMDGEEIAFALLHRSLSANVRINRLLSFQARNDLTASASLKDMLLAGSSAPSSPTSTPFAPDVPTIAPIIGGLAVLVAEYEAVVLSGLTAWSLRFYMHQHAYALWRYILQNARNYTPAQISTAARQIISASQRAAQAAPSFPNNPNNQLLLDEIRDIAEGIGQDFGQIANAASSESWPKLADILRNHGWLQDVFKGTLPYKDLTPEQRRILAELLRKLVQAGRLGCGVAAAFWSKYVADGSSSGSGSHLTASEDSVKPQFVEVGFVGDEGEPEFQHFAWLEDYLGTVNRTVTCPTVTAAPITAGESVKIDLLKACSRLKHSPFGDVKFELLSRGDIAAIPKQRRGFLNIEEGLRSAPGRVDDIAPEELLYGDPETVATLGTAQISGSTITYKTSSTDLRGGGDLLAVKMTEPVDPELGPLFAASQYFLVRVPIKNRPTCVISDQSVGREVKDGAVQIERGETLRLDFDKICPNKYQDLKKVDAKIIYPSQSVWEGASTKKDEDKNTVDLTWASDVVGDAAKIEFEAVNYGNESVKAELSVDIEDVVPQCKTADIDIVKKKGVVATTPTKVTVECPMPRGLVPVTAFGSLSPLSFDVQPHDQFLGPKVGDPAVGEFSEVNIIHEPTGDDPVARVELSFTPAKDFVGTTAAQIMATNIGAIRKTRSTVRVKVREKPLFTCDEKIDDVYVNSSNKEPAFEITCKSEDGTALELPVNFYSLIKPKYGKVEYQGTDSNSDGSVTGKFVYRPDGSWIDFQANNYHDTFTFFAEQPSTQTEATPTSITVKPGS